MNTLRIIFFGSTFDSVIVLEKLFSGSIVAVVTQTPRPVGRKQTLTPTPVETWGKEHGLTVLSFSSHPIKPWLYKDEQQVINTLQPLKADLLISACYGQRIPWEAIKDTRFGGLNVHPSLLPRWRGADPVPWAILSGDHQTGVTIVTLSKEFDEGRIIAQKKIPIMDTDTSDPLRTKLFAIGADLLEESLGCVIAGEAKQSPKIATPRQSAGLAMTQYPYARRLTRDDGFEPWETILRAFEDREEAIRIERKFRAFSLWPSIWTRIRIMNHVLGIMAEKRLKIISCHLERLTHSPIPPFPHHLVLETVQLEGKKPVSWKQFHEAYHLEVSFFSPFSHLTARGK